MIFRVLGRPKAYLKCLYVLFLYFVVLVGIVDILPILLIVKNSGAIITDWQGKNDFSKGQVLVSPNKKIDPSFVKFNMAKNILLIP